MSPPGARTASRAAAAECLDTSYIWLPLLLLSCCASTRCPLSLTHSLSPCFELGLVRGAGAALPHRSAASAGLCSCPKDPSLQIHPAQPWDLGCPSHHLDNVCSLGLRNLSRDLERQSCALGLDGDNSPFSWGTGSLLCLWRNQLLEEPQATSETMVPLQLWRTHF